MVPAHPAQDFGSFPWSNGGGMWPSNYTPQVDANGLESWTVEKWRWAEYITVHDGAVRVAVSGAGVQDQDLGSLTRHLEVLLAKEMSHPGAEYTLTMDLSCNWGISDYGIANHLVPFLRRWPVCRRLKLYQTSIGDRALGELSGWVADGHVHELHLSDLGGPVSGEAVLKFLRKIHRRGQYPYWSKGGGGQAALWLRLEHNRIPHVDEVVARGRAEGLSLRVLGKADLSSVRPGAPIKGRRVPAVHLVLFRLQHSKAPPPESRLTTGQKLLMMLQENAPALEKAPVRQEPQPLSNDEFRLWQMQAREDMECGADELNKETFGDDTEGGWSFEENLAANERLACQAWTKTAMGVFGGIFPPYGGQADFASATTTDAFPEFNSSYEADSASTASGNALSKHHLANVARCEVEEEIYNALALNPTLQKLDFDGRVRQYLHAIRNVGGQHKVREAMRELHTATISKPRHTIQKWPAYLVALLKRFIADMPGRVQQLRRFS